MKVLIVDDSSTMRKIIHRSLRQSGIKLDEVLEASNGKEALEVLKGNKVDIVLTDINMPEMNGLEFIKALKSSDETSNIPVVVISTEGTEDVVKEAQELGASGFIRKPFTPDSIKEKFQEVIG